MPRSPALQEGRSKLSQRARGALVHGLRTLTVRSSQHRRHRVLADEAARARVDGDLTTLRRRCRHRKPRSRSPSPTTFTGRSRGRGRAPRVSEPPRRRAVGHPRRRQPHCRRVASEASPRGQPRPALPDSCGGCPTPCSARACRRWAMRLCCRAGGHPQLDCC